MTTPATANSDELLNRAAEQARVVVRELNRLGQLCQEAAGAVGDAALSGRLVACGNYALDEADTATDAAKRIDAIRGKLAEGAS